MYTFIIVFKIYAGSESVSYFQMITNYCFVQNPENLFCSAIRNNINLLYKLKVVSRKKIKTKAV